MSNYKPKKNVQGFLAYRKDNEKQIIKTHKVKKREDITRIAASYWMKESDITHTYYQKLAITRLEKKKQLQDELKQLRDSLTTIFTSTGPPALPNTLPSNEHLIELLSINSGIDSMNYVELSQQPFMDLSIQLKDYVPSGTLQFNFDTILQSFIEDGL
ncbi:hypothetical protein HDV02_004130 [Globomyces sp. JEL0801]|nr:hypothetical protein HDV02_004130 [Globomyces sp. JEL0801]